MFFLALRTDICTKTARYYDHWSIKTSAVNCYGKKTMLVQCHAVLIFQSCASVCKLRDWDVFLVALGDLPKYHEFLLFATVASTLVATDVPVLKRATGISGTLSACSRRQHSFSCRNSSEDSSWIVVTVYIPFLGRYLLNMFTTHLP